jgi:hypothetical protein
VTRDVGQYYHIFNNYFALYQRRRQKPLCGFKRRDRVVTSNKKSKTHTKKSPSHSMKCMNMQRRDEMIANQNRQAVMMLQQGSEAAAIIMLKRNLQIWLQMAVSANHSRSNNNDSTKIHTENGSATRSYHDDGDNDDGNDTCASHVSCHDELDSIEISTIDTPAPIGKLMTNLDIVIMSSLPTIEMYQPTVAVHGENDTGSATQAVAMYNSVFLFTDHMVLQHRDVVSGIILYHIALANHRYAIRHSCSGTMSMALDLYHKCAMIVQNISSSLKEQSVYSLDSNDDDDDVDDAKTYEPLLYVLQVAIFHNQEHIHATFGNDIRAQLCHDKVRSLLQSWSDDSIPQSKLMESEYMFFIRHHPLDRPLGHPLGHPWDGMNPTIMSPASTHEMQPTMAGVGIYTAAAA